MSLLVENKSAANRGFAPVFHNVNYKTHTMNWTLILGYFILILIQYLSIQAIPVSIIGGIIGRISKNIFLGMLVGGLITWFLINLIWLKVYNYNLPFLAFVLSFSFQFINLKLNNKELTETSKQMIVAEMWSILLIAIYVLALKEFNWI